MKCLIVNNGVHLIKKRYPGECSGGKGSADRERTGGDKQMKLKPNLKEIITVEIQKNLKNHNRWNLNKAKNDEIQTKFKKRWE